MFSSVFQYLPLLFCPLPSLSGPIIRPLHIYTTLSPALHSITVILGVEFCHYCKAQPWRLSLITVQGESDPSSSRLTARSLLRPPCSSVTPPCRIPHLPSHPLHFMSRYRIPLSALHTLLLTTTAAATPGVPAIIHRVAPPPTNHHLCRTQPDTHGITTFLHSCSPDWCYPQHNDPSQNWHTQTESPHLLSFHTLIPIPQLTSICPTESELNSEQPQQV